MNFIKVKQWTDEKTRLINLDNVESIREAPVSNSPLTERLAIYLKSGGRIYVLDNLDSIYKCIIQRESKSWEN